MDISRLTRAIKRLFRSSPVDRDYTLDVAIREALFEDALAQPLPGAWERLRKAIIDRRLKSYGMWVLDEPLRDPPEFFPTVLNGEQYRRAMRSYAVSRDTYNRQIREAMWSTMLPTFSALVNW